MSESGIGGGGLGIGQTAPVPQVEAGQNGVSPGAGERERWRREGEKVSGERTVEEGAAQPDGAPDLAEESDRPPHRIDSLA